MTARPDPLSVPCRRCRAPERTSCLSASSRPCRPHKARERDALAVAAHSDPVLDGVLPGTGPCLLCGVKGLGSRHRVIDAVAGSMAAGDDEGTCAAEYGLSPDAVKVIAEWAGRWPGAWL